jgi:hypothetical protein
MTRGSNALGGKVWKFGDNINTDLMLPGPWLYRSAEEQAKATGSSADSITAWDRRVRPPGRYAIAASGFCWPRR